MIPLVAWTISATLAQNQELLKRERIVWKAETRGPLLVVAPDTPTPIRVQLPREGVINVLEFADRTQRKLMKWGSVSALVPQTMRILNLRLGKPEASAVTPQDAIIALAASLDEAQWTRLGEASGLGRDDLKPQQQPLFTALLPPLRTNNGPVPPEALERARLHVQQHTVFDLAYYNEQVNALNGDDLSNGKLIRSSRQPVLQRDYAQKNQRNQDLSGSRLTLKLPNRLKPSQLDYKSPTLDRQVDLSGAKTVAELIARAAKATGLEILADKRLAELPVWLRSKPGQSARVGELLEALALSVTGAFRKLEAPNETPLWLLTDDIEGLGKRLRRQAAWLEEQDNAGAIRARESRRTLKAINPLRFIAYDNAYHFSPELVGKIRQNGSNRPTVLPLTAFSAALTEQLTPLVQKELTAIREGRAFRGFGGIENPTIDPNHIKLSLRAADLSLEVPGYGVYYDDSLGRTLSLALTSAARSAPEPTPVRPSVAQRFAIVFPKTAEQARQAVTVAASAKLTALWIATQSDALEPLKAALEAGKEAHLPIAALVPVAQEPHNAPPDINLLGDTGPYRLPDAPETAAGLLPYLQTVATLPGLAALVLDKTAAPGYEHEFSSTISPGSRPNAPLPYGYTPLRRLRFARAEGFDPIDLSDSSGPGFFLSPNHWEWSTHAHPRLPYPMQRWSDTRFEANKALLEQVFSALKTAVPELPLWIRERQSAADHSSWFGSWDKADALPLYDDPPGMDTVDPIKQARAFSQHVLFTHPMPAVADAESFLTGLLAGETNRDKTFLWDGFVLDLQALPVEEALAVLRKINL